MFPACHSLSEMSDQSFFRFFKWIYQASLILFGLKWGPNNFYMAMAKMVIDVLSAFLILHIPGALLCWTWPL